MNRRHYAVTLQQASEESPTLARLTALTRDSSDRLKAIELLIPAALRPAVQAGPIDGDSWCLLVKSNAAAAKGFGRPAGIMATGSRLIRRTSAACTELPTRR